MFQTILVVLLFAGLLVSFVGMTPFGAVETVKLWSKIVKQPVMGGEGYGPINMRYRAGGLTAVDVQWISVGIYFLLLFSFIGLALYQQAHILPRT